MSAMNQPPNVEIPGNVVLGQGTVIRGNNSFNRFLSTAPKALTIGCNSLMDQVHFALGPEAVVEIGDHCYFTSPILLSECSMKIGSRVMIGWNTTITDSDFHPIEPALRMIDAVACSPLNKGVTRPKLTPAAVVIEDDVWIGPCVTILKGVRIGAGSFIEPGSMVSRDIPPGSRVLGNPARIVGGVEP